MSVEIKMLIIAPFETYGNKNDIKMKQNTLIILFFKLLKRRNKKKKEAGKYSTLAMEALIRC